MSSEVLKAAAEVSGASGDAEVPKFDSPKSADGTEESPESGGDGNIPEFEGENDDEKENNENSSDDETRADDGVDDGLPKDVADTKKTGGTYGELTSSDQWGGHLEDPPPHEVHHMPADSVNGLERNDGPAIVMDKADHRQTASCGNSLEAREYREKQRELIDAGKFEEAMQMDIDDIHEKFGDKYDDAIEQMKSAAEEKGLI